MARDSYPSETQDRFLVRMPDGMRDRIKAAADANNRSMNAEIISTLEEKYPAPLNNQEAKLIEFYREIVSRYESGETWHDEIVAQVVFQEFMEMTHNLHDYGERGSGKKVLRDEIEKSVQKHIALEAEYRKELKR